ncbi:MAG: hypothetical protein N2376_15065 [Clostridia bacterium]|nr:hypothetical protein [Clostridia bacterium]
MAELTAFAYKEGDIEEYALPPLLVRSNKIYDYLSNQGLVQALEEKANQDRKSLFKNYKKYHQMLEATMGEGYPEACLLYMAEH